MNDRTLIRSAVLLCALSLAVTVLLLMETRSIVLRDGVAQIAPPANYGGSDDCLDVKSVDCKDLVCECTCSQVPGRCELTRTCDCSMDANGWAQKTCEYCTNEENRSDRKWDDMCSGSQCRSVCGDDEECVKACWYCLARNNKGLRYDGGGCDHCTRSCSDSGCRKDCYERV